MTQILYVYIKLSTDRKKESTEKSNFDYDSIVDYIDVTRIINK